VRLRLEGPIPPAIAALVASDLRTAFGRRDVELIRREGSTPAAPEGAQRTGAAATGAQPSAREMVLTVAAASERFDQIVLTLEGAGASTLTRRLNLTSVPADGRVLALVVAADEMLVASNDERLPRKRAAGAAPDSTPADSPTTAAGTRRLGWRAYGLLAAQARQGLTVWAADRAGTVDTRLLGVRLAAGAGLIDHGPLSLTFDVGARVGRLWFQGRAQAGPPPIELSEYVVSVDAILTLDVELGRSPVALRLGVGGGVLLMSQVVTVSATDGRDKTTSTDVTGASGVAFESQGGIVLSF
jgi:hypothetical protein